MQGIRRLVQWMVVFSVLLSLTAPIAALSPLMASEVTAQTDSDGDGLFDDDEVNSYGTDPNLWDTDGDGLSDGDEVLVYGTNPLTGDPDGDSVWDADEIANGTNPNAPPPVCEQGFVAQGDICVEDAVTDTDGDGLTDWYELNVSFTNPGISDTDSDGLSDWEELNHPHGPLDPLNPDTDGDGAPDGSDINPLVPDADQDEIADENDNCPNVSNPGQEDSDSDGSGDACDDLPFGDQPWEYSLLDGEVTVVYPAKYQEGEPSASIVPLPANLPYDFSSQTAVAFEVSSTGNFAYPMTICTNFAVNFEKPEEARLFSFRTGTWMEITSAGYPQGGTLCGEASSQGTFAVAELKLAAGSDIEVGSAVTYVDPEQTSVSVSFEEVTAAGRIDVAALQIPPVVPWNDPSGYLPGDTSFVLAWSVASTAQFTGAEICVSFDPALFPGLGPVALAIESDGGWTVAQVAENGASQLCVQTGSALSNVLIGPLDTHPIRISFTDGEGQQVIGDNACIQLEVIEAIYDSGELALCDVLDGSPQDGLLERNFPAGNYSIAIGSGGVQGIPGYVLDPAVAAATVIESSLTQPTSYSLALLPVNTGEGPSQFVDPATGASIDFSNVTQPGITSVVADSNPPVLPSGFRLEGALYFDIQTTALFDGDAYVCLPYDPTAFGDPGALKLLHYEAGEWADVTDSNTWDESGGVICGSVASFSPFAVAQSADDSTNIHVLTQGANGIPAAGAYVYVVSTAACDSSEYAIAAQGYTDENGLFSAPDIVPGSYCVIEAGAPLGYGNNQTPNHFVTVSEGETLTVTFTFEYHPPDPAVYGLVRLHIVDHVGNPVSGDSCAVISPSQVDGLTIICDAIPTQPESWRDGLIDIYVTGGGALLTSYQPPVMWQLAGTLPTTLLADPGEIIDLDIVLEPTGNGSVWVQTYRPSQTSEGVSGAVFDITDARNCSGSGNVVGQVTTALPANQPEQPASGILELPPGDYCAEFVSAPADVGYVITARQPFSVSAGWTEAVYFGFQDAPPARLRVIAQGASGIAAPEASFSIFSASDCANLQDNVGGISTDENGVGTYVNIDAGTYCVVHDQAPSGFGGLDVERQLITAVAGQTVDATFTYAVHPPDPAIYGLIRLEVLDDSGSPFSSENVCVTISPGQVNGETTICDVDPDVQGANLDGVIDIYVTASGASVVSMQPPLLWRLQDPSLLPLTLSVAPGEVVTEQVSIEPTGLGIANIVTYATPAIQPGATFDIREGSSCLDDDALAVPQLVTNVDGVAPDGFTAESYVELAPGDYCAIHVAAPSGLELHYASSPRQAFTIYSTGYSPVYFQYLYLDNTPASEDPVQVVPPGAPTGMTITFSAVLVPGVTTVTVDSDPPSIPAGFSLDGAIFYEIDTTASFDGLITICLPYDPGSFGNPSAVKLMHHEGGSWVDVTTSNDPVGGIICGSAVSLSPFGIMEPEGSTSNTPSSASPVTVSGLADGAVSVTFPSVTVAGATNAIPVGNSGDIPEGYAINSAIFYDIQTTATFTGLAEVCITFDSVQFFDRSEVRLFHDVGGEWIDITSGGDPANGTICGMTDHFSPFGVMEPEPLTGSLTIELRNELGGLQPGYCIWLNNPNDQWILLCDDQNDDPDDQWDGVISAELPVGVYTTGSYGPPDNYGLTSSLPTSIEITESGPVVLTLNHAPLTEATIFVDIVDGDGNPITGGCAGPFVPSTPGYRDCWWLDANGDGTVVISGIFTSGTVELGVLIGQGVTYGDWHASGSAEIAVGLTYAELTIVVEPSVVITSTIDGTPAPVDACYQLGDWVGCDRVDGLDGRTVLYGLPAGEYELSLYDSYVTSVSAVDLPRNVTVTGSGTDEIVVDFMTNAPSLVVNLEDDDGAPVLSGCFELTGVSHPVACDRDDGVIDGATSFHGLAGQGEVSLAFIGEIELQGCCDAIAVDLTEEATVEIDYLAPSPVFVLVVTDQDGNPWIVSNPWQHGAGQLCYSVESESHFSSCDAWDGQLDGRVTFYEYGGLYPGTYSLIRYGESVSVPLVITGGATQYVPITIMRTEEAARAVITAVDEAGVPASGACYQLHGPSWTTSLCDSSDGVLDGIATYRSSDPLDPGTLTVIEEKAPDGLARTLSTVIEHNGEMPVEITIEHSGYLTGEGEVTIVDEDTGITLTFANVVKPGRTTVEPISVGETPFPPDSGVFGLGGAMYYEISTTATFLDAITICLPSSDPADRLLHFDDGAWHDVTDDGFPSGGTICGTVRSLSPFAVVPLKETAPDSMVVSGFYAPVDMAEGVYNSVKGGSTVPLKFEVHQDGVELTDTGVIASFTVSTISCDPGANEDAVEYTTLGGTNLKYSGGMFHQNWKTPKSKGCYKVVVTTVDGATLVAYFRLR